MDYVKNNFKKILLFAIGIFVFPFLLEFVISAVHDVSEFSDETWFSFYGSYIGAIISLFVMFITFKKSDYENKKIIRKQKEKFEIDSEKEKIKRIIHVLLLDDYYFLNPDTVSENIDRFNKDLSYVEFDTLELGFVLKEDEILFKELLELQKEEVRILNTIIKEIPNVKTKDEFNIVKMNAGLELSKIVTLRRSSIKTMYEEYIKKMYDKYYE